MTVYYINNRINPANAVRGLYADGTAPVCEGFSVFGSVVGTNVNFRQCLIAGEDVSTTSVGTYNVVLSNAASVKFYNLSLSFKGIVDDEQYEDVNVGGVVYLSVYIGTSSSARVFFEASKYRVCYKQEVVVNIPNFSDVSVGSGENIYFYFEYKGDNAHNGVVVNFNGRVNVDD